MKWLTWWRWCLCNIQFGTHPSIDDKEEFEHEFNRVHEWRLVFEEYGPDIVYIKGANTVADVISLLDFNSALNTKRKQNWITMTKCLCRLDSNHAINSNDEHNKHMNQVFTHHGEEVKRYPLTKKEIVELQKRDRNLKFYFKPKNANQKL